MVFSSITFLYYFLPAVMILYFLSPQKMKNLVLLISSLIFYAWGEPKYIFLMIITIIVGYIFGLLISNSNSQKKKKILLITAIALFVGSLGFFKYTNFLFGRFWTIKVLLPIGISFYTFQIISYLVDVYRGEVASQKNIIKLACYVAMFPQLIAGPIVRYQRVATELDYREHTIDKCASGIRRFMQGLAKKIIIANNLYGLCEVLKNLSEPSVLSYWILAIAITLHIYFDFSGYSDMAIGLGKIFGFTFNENFDYPYVSSSITEFWRRWHMSLGTWFRDYIYIPLGGNRKGKIRWFVNIMVVWGLTGLWHGAAWNFVIWGLFYGILLIIEKKWTLSFFQKNKWIGHIYTMLLVVIGFVIFDCESIGAIGVFLKRMFGFAGLPIVSASTVYYLRSYLIILILACVFSVPVFKKIKRPMYAESVIYVALMLVMTAALINGSFNPFLYFRF